MKKEIKIKDRTYLLEQNLLVLMKYEEISGKNALNYKENVTLTDTINVFYAMLIVNNQHFTMAKKEFLNILNENNNYLKEFTLFLNEMQNEIITKEEESEEDKKKEKK